MSKEKEDNYVGGYCERYTKDESEISQTSSGVQKKLSIKQTQKRMFLKYFIIFFGIIAMFFVFLIAGNFGSKRISGTELFEGATLKLNENNNVKFKVGEESHGIKIDSVRIDSVDITISSEPIKLSLKINEIQEVDIDGDGSKDLVVKLIQIVNGKATLAVRKIEQNRCIENWKCDEWSSCERGKQERECVDLNECGGDFGMPPQKKGCSEMEFVDWDDTGNWSGVENGNESDNGEREGVNKTDEILGEEKEGDLNNSLDNQIMTNNTELNESLKLNESKKLRINSFLHIAYTIK